MTLSSLLLDAVLECARSGQLTKAAEKLFISQSALSQRISQLESEIGAPVLVRTRSGVTLTEAGLVLMQYAQQKEQLEREALQRVKGHSKGELFGTIRIAGFSSIMSSLVFTALEPFVTKNPELGLEFRVLPVNDLLQCLKRGEADFVILDFGVEEKGLTSKLLGFERSVLVQKKGYKGQNVYLDHDERDRTTTEYFRDQNEGIFKRRYMGDIHGLIQGVKLGFGKAILPKHLVTKDLSFEILNPKKVLKLPIIVYYHDQQSVLQLHQQILEQLTKGFAKFL